jgi:flavorubredoxin/NADPH-dependent 2,4-dienoyl-CoA reductase/sulfur reductase-like enzyme
MLKALEVKKDIYWVGSQDPELRVFDIVMYTPYGTTYNSYVVKGSEKTAIFETVKEKTFEQYLERLKFLNINFDEIAYIVVDHTEPDHAGSVAKLLEYAKNAKVVGSAAAIRFLKQIANRPFEEIIVKHGDTLSLGNKTLRFIDAPFLHWPDSIYTYVEEDNLLMTCDSFGSHYCFDGMFNDLIPQDKKPEYMDALKYYFDCIMGPFKSYVLKALKKIDKLKIDTICPGHGPILRENIEEYFETYRKWSTEIAPSDGKTRVVLSYVTAYGYTEQLALKIAEGIKSQINDAEIDMYDVIYHKQEDILEKIYLADAVLFGSPTINGDALKPILDILTIMNPIVHGRKIAGAFGSFGWSGEAVPNIEARLKALRMKLVTPGLKINFKPSEAELLEAFKYGESVALKIKEAQSKGVKPLKRSNIKLWKCIVCNEVFEGEFPPEVCPACGADKSQFIEVKKEEINFNLSRNEKYVIIGNGAAGYYAADSIKKRNSEADIEIISSEKVLTYYRPQLSDLLIEDIDEKSFFLSPEEWYKSQGIKLLLNTRVEAINSKESTLTLQTGEKISYDKLILATGSSNFIPPITGVEKKGVFTLKDIDDLNNIKAAMNTASNAVVVGGGILGIEAASALKKSGLNVTVVELMPRLLPIQLDKEGSEIFEKEVQEFGITALKGESAAEIIGAGSVSGLKLKSGKTIPADLIIFSVGIRSNKSLAEKAGIEVDRGIIVNKNMETNIPNIYACGDAAQIGNKVYGNWPAAIEMAKVAGANAVGDKIIFTDFVNSTVFSELNLELYSIGEIPEISSDIIELGYRDASKKVYKKLFFKNNKLIGGILLGDKSKAVKLNNAILNRSGFAEVLKEDIL